MSNPRPKPVLLLILDGWGHRVETEHNAIALATLPNWDHLCATYPRNLVQTHGLNVGLPDGQMGNSEVGHMNIGSGRIVYQDLTRVDAAIEDGSLARNQALLSACEAAKKNGATLHLLGLLSPGGVHSHENHLFAMIAIAADVGVSRIAVHAFLDGRDTPPRSALASIERLEACCAKYPAAFVASVSGRYYAMDRDQRWQRVQSAYQAMAEAQSELHAPSAAAALEMAYARDENDEFVKPTVIGEGARFNDGDAVIFMNFRADRARQMTQVLVDPEFSGFARDRRIALSAFVTLTEYSADLPVSAIAFSAQSMHNTLGEYLSALGLRQLRIAETEKYAHVTFFFSGGREAPFDGEERVLVPSPKVATYDLKPEMSLPELTDQLVAAIESQRFDFIACNIANGDMVGHSGIESAAIKAAEAVDVALGRLHTAILAAGGEMLITADHGNLEQMLDDDGVAHTQHTVGPVPLVYVGRKAIVHGGALRDLAPTVLALMGLAQPEEMTGRNLVEFLD
jgi:2,3-bisphosphoglycerate-independent phosphoglycerate mutase